MAPELCQRLSGDSDRHGGEGQAGFVTSGSDRRNRSWVWGGGFGARAGWGWVSALGSCGVSDSAVPKPRVTAQPLSPHSMPRAGKCGRLELGLQRKQRS